MTAVAEKTFVVGLYADYDTARDLIVGQWGDDAIVIAGRAHKTAEMQLLAARSSDGEICGVAYYRMNGAVALLGAIIVTDMRRGIGSALFEAVAAEAREMKLRKLRAITTNDNFEAMKFYQKHGMRFMTLFAGGADAYRAFKPGLHPIGYHGIPCRDVLELEIDL